MGARRHVTNKLRSAYKKASKSDKSRILDEVIATTGMGRSTARGMLSGPQLPAPAEQLDRRRLRPKVYGDDARALLRHVWALMGFPCGKYLVVMLPMWLSSTCGRTHRRRWGHNARPCRPPPHREWTQARRRPWTARSSCAATARVWWSKSLSAASQIVPGPGTGRSSRRSSAATAPRPVVWRMVSPGPRQPPSAAWRYDTGEELALLNQLWPLVSLRLNFFTPTKKPTIGSGRCRGPGASRRRHG